ncbi:hypothetical protein F5Y11DRAFT_328081 [Daldinia sp. FL1419]|nr:hypothetical protein F5Y11DRAFT_328081 [Daldinia sp. FL1419]
MGRLNKDTMGREVKVNMDTDKRQEQIHDLQLRHQINHSNTELLNKDEDVRRLRVRILMLRDENTSLREEIAHNNDTHNKLSAKCDDLGGQIEAKMDVIRSQEKQLRKQEREYSNLKAELQAMNNATQDSANLLAEKLSLSRELAVLKPEIEHLRSQVNHQQATLAEKLALERQVDTLEVELANEKKATKRVMQKRESNDRVEDELRQKLREAEKRLTAEKSERERLEDQLEQEKRTHQISLQEQDSTRELEADLRKKLQEVQRQLRQEKDDRERLEEELQTTKLAAKKTLKNSKTNVEDELRSQVEELEANLESQRKETAKIRRESQELISEASARSDQLEKKVEKLKTKLRETQEQLKQCQSDLRKAQQSRLAISDDATTVNGRSQVFRRRKVQDMTADDFTQIEIQTPGADDTTKGRRALKKRGLEPSVLGEKSLFSITPFLNRTKSIMEDTPKADEETLDNSFAAATIEREATEPMPEVPEAAEAEVAREQTNSPAPSEGEKPKPSSKSRGRPKKVLGEAPSAKKNAQPVSKKSTKTKGSLEKVVEESDEKVQEDECDAAEPAEKTANVKFNIGLPQDESTSVGINGEVPKKKKRKVLGSTKTLFDEEEGEAPARKPSKVQLGGKRAVNKALLGVQKSAFAGQASFSPLKKDRKGTGASFMA